MKRLLLLPILCLMPAAQAVDYVKCEAMQKALGRANNTAFKVWRDARIIAELDLGLNGKEASAAAKASPEYKKALMRIDRIQADYDAAGCY